MNRNNLSNILNTFLPHKDRHLILVAGIAAFASIVSVLQNILQMQRNAIIWQINISIGFGLIGLVVSLIALFLIIKSHKNASGIFLVSYVILNGFLTAYLYINMGFFMQLVITLAGTIISLEFLEGRLRLWFIWISIISGGIAFGSDFLTLDWRVPNDSIGLKYILALGIFLLFTFRLMRRFGTYLLRTRIRIIVVGINILVVILITVGASILTGQFITQNSYKKMSAASIAISSEIDNMIGFQLNEVLSKSLSPSLVELMLIGETSNVGRSQEYSRVEKLINSWIDIEKELIDSFGLLNKNGFNVIDSSIVNIGNNEGSFSYFSEPLISRGSYISPLMLSEDNQRFFVISSPVFDTNSQVLGIFRVRYKGDYLQKIIEKYNDLVGENSFGVLLDEHNIILAHGKENFSINSLTIDLSENIIKKLQVENRLTESIHKIDVYGLADTLEYTSSNSVFEAPLLLSDRKGVSGFTAIGILSKQPWKVLFAQPMSISISFLQEQMKLIILTAELIIGSVFGVSIFLSQRFTSPITHLTQVAEEYIQGNLDVEPNISTEDEIGELARSFTQMANQLANSFNELDSRIQERTRGIELGIAVGRRLSTILNERNLVKEVVNQISFAFRFYQIQLYLLDRTKQNLWVAAGQGQIGDMLVQQSHQVLIGEGVVGISADKKMSVLVSDTVNEPNWLPNHHLKDTKSELAVPILLGDKLLGILDIQHDILNGIKTDTVAVIELIAGQVATSLQNARLLEEIERKTYRDQAVSASVEEIYSTSDQERSLKIAVREIGKVSKGSKTIIRLLDS